MEKGQQWGDFVEMASHDLDHQIGAAISLIHEANEWFKQPEFEGLNLSDFNIEIVCIKSTVQYPGGTMGLKLTKK